ncbi:MAG: glycosyltransferase family 39 protein [candidate division WOR-3 bacterium]|nr:MAG: glycosyltransferase family 39 protein [candidate division WOR-3 bacterium]UCF06914.1 MAG: glycosyltransferase family 39 protein [bacterium]
MKLKRPSSAHITLLVILAVAAALRLYYAFTFKAKPDFSDMAIYNELALSGGIPTSPPPGYPLFLRTIYFVFGAYNYTAVYIVQTLIGILTVYLIYIAVTKVADREAGLIAGGIAAIYPNFIAYTVTTMTETLGIFLVVLLTATMTLPSSTKRQSIYAAIVLSIGYLIRPAFLFFFPGALGGVKRRLVLIITLVAVLGPWYIYASVAGGGSNRAALGFYKSYNPKATGIKHYRIEETELGSRDLPSGTYLKEAMKFILNNKWKTLDLIYKKATLIISRGYDLYVLRDFVGYNSARVHIMLYAYIPVMILGFLGMLRLYDKQNRVIAFTLTSYLVLNVLLSIFKIRYRVLAEPLLIMYAAIFLAAKCSFPKLHRIKDST